MDENQSRILADFTRALDELDNVMESVAEIQLDWSLQEDEWSIRQVLHHLADDGNVYTFIIERALATPGCKVFFGGFPGNEVWADRLGFDLRPIDRAWDLLHAQRRFLAELVSHYLDRWSNQVGYFNEAGEQVAERDVAQLIQMLTKHMQEHTRMIKDILVANQGG